MRPVSHSNKNKVMTKKETQSKKESKQIEIEWIHERIAKKVAIKPSDAVKSKAKKSELII